MECRKAKEILVAVGPQRADMIKALMHASTCQECKKLAMQVAIEPADQGETSTVEILLTYVNGNRAFLFSKNQKP